MGKQAVCNVCNAAEAYPTVELARAAAVVHVLRWHPEIYEAACGRPAADRLRELGL